MKETMNLEISTWTIVKVFLLAVLFYVLFSIRDIIALFFLVLILTASFRPIVNRWEKKIGRHLAVLTLMIIALLILAFVIYLIVPLIIDQTKQLVAAIPDMLDRYDLLRNYVPNIKESISSISNNIGKITGSFVTITAGVFGGVLAFFMAIVLTIYLLLDKESFKKVISFVFPSRQEEIATEVSKKISQKIGNWFRGQMLLGLIIAVIDLVGLLIIGVPYALVLAIISGIFEIVPTIGPLIAGLVAVLVALSDSPLKAILVVALYFIVQQIENSFVVPKIMQKAVGLSPVIIIFAILIGAKLMGIIGAILAVPVVGSIAVVVQEWPAIKQSLKNNG